MRDPFALGGVSAALLLGYVTVREYFLGARGARRASGGGWTAAFVGLFERDRRRYGGYLVHLGIAVMAVAIVGSNIYQLQVRRTVAPGESFEVGDYTIAYEQLRRRPGTANGVESETVAVLRVTEGDAEVARLEPGRRTFRNFPGQPMTIVAVETRLLGDLYVFVQGWGRERGRGVQRLRQSAHALALGRRRRLHPGRRDHLRAGAGAGASAARASGRRDAAGVAMRVALAIAALAIAALAIAALAIVAIASLASAPA